MKIITNELIQKFKEYLIDEEKSGVVNVLNRLQQSFEIRDMQIEEISTEEVIKKIYEEGTQ